MTAVDYLRSIGISPSEIIAVYKEEETELYNLRDILDGFLETNRIEDDGEV